MKKNKNKKAVALKYDLLKDKAPRVTAKGSGITAEKIIELAEEHGIPIKDDPDLVKVLSGLDINETIPPDIYMVVAELLAFVYSVNKKHQEK